MWAEFCSAVSSIFPVDLSRAAVFQENIQLGASPLLHSHHHRVCWRSRKPCTDKKKKKSSCIFKVLKVWEAWGVFQHCWLLQEEETCNFCSWVLLQIKAQLESERGRR